MDQNMIRKRASPNYDDASRPCMARSNSALENALKILDSILRDKRGFPHYKKVSQVVNQF
jgi:hypothetical protein